MDQVIDKGWPDSEELDPDTGWSQDIVSNLTPAIRQSAGLGTEVGAGLALDAKTSKLLLGGPWGWAAYGAINFGGGASANIAAQKLRGEEKLNWGEVISSGLLGIIPFTSLRFGKKATQLVGKQGSVRRAITGGAGLGASDRFIQSGINEGELPSAGDVATGALTGGAFGGGFQQIGGAFVSNNLRNQIVKADQEGRSDDLARMIWQWRKSIDSPDAAIRNYDTYDDYIKGIEQTATAQMRPPSGDYYKDLEDFYKGENIQFPVRAIEDVPQPVRTNMMWESGLKGGKFDYDVWSSKVLRGRRYRSRQTVEDFETIFGKGVNFEAYRDNVVMPAFRQEWGPIIRSLGYNENSLQLHHIFSIRASAGLYDGLTYGSQEWADVTTVLLEHYLRPGNLPKNLIPVIGKTTDKGTPHYLAHKYLDDMLGKVGSERFFTKEVRNAMKNDHGIRIQKANDLAKIMKQSEQIVVQAQEVWSTIYGRNTEIPEELVEKLSQLPATTDPKYKVDVPLEDLVKQVVKDGGFEPWSEMSRNEFVNWLDQFSGSAFTQLRDLFIQESGLSAEEAMSTRIGRRLQQYFDNKLRALNPIKKKFRKKK
tara:strand:+ start:154 stop:1932 length:1779 start_codon:yes stop_codon:yes gene_type:complete